ncbi:MAG: acetolactate synthase 2 catalytic subunit [Candidatus Velthaea sp.]
MNITGAEAVLSALDREGVEFVFGYPGGAIMPLYDALYGHRVRHVLVRHEAAAVFAASGFARTSGRVGVCCATSGPGATNLVTGLLDALMDSVPLVAITGQVRSELMGTDGFQEADVCAITQAATKRNYLVRDPNTIAQTVAEAFALARSGRPGPVLVDIPSDVLKALVPKHAPVHETKIFAKPVPRASETSIRAAADLLRAAHRPIIIIGGGVRYGDALGHFRELVDLTGAPHTATINALGAAAPHDPHFLGMLGMHGTKAANRAVHSADVILALGMRFDDRVTGRPDRFATSAKIVHADIDATEFGKIIAPEVSLHGELGTTLAALNAELRTQHVPRFHDWAAEARTLGGPLPSDRVDGLAATDVLDRFFERIPSDAIVTTDVGQHQMWAAQRVHPEHPRAFATSAGLGSMGFGLPSAIGARFANPGKPVFTITGDGGFQMAFAELATLKRYGVDVRIVLIDNRNLGMVRQWQELFYDARYSATNLSDNPDFVALAEAFGVRATRVDDVRDLDAAIDAFLAQPGPALLHCACYPIENVWPMIPAGGSADELMEART